MTKAKKFRPSKALTAYNLCAKDWLKTNSGPRDDFRSYYKALNPSVILSFEEQVLAIKKASSIVLPAATVT
ncbi:hypothetical protein SERLA73DRAFT_73913 [Serpula lacrymans var. lacrymans S7.3]|uniref:Uncharacterized protein n=2 Tax=Serpula lacrymans var. lacrymans TaxID=341189 RepID=F8PXB0_SERL3|nr:uncharacterized protein SERLADRAFT_438546 [Serpula lacrymans var. lacrymans S7.9]EGN99385.1 hypothetical protein SERLA73DRAFT_73913 [Serpula lacrymans var. lacrymans S7.3]EGO24945.1 hypothetical protein SERLADRAFT_438546 [Serpula lacrymans var. lacrymans S7.9]